MISSKKLFRRKRFSLLGNEENQCCTTSSPTQKGHFVVYSADQKRFLIPLVYLNNKIFRELLKWSEEEFGLGINGPITLPCDASFIEYIVTLVKRGAAKDLEKHLLTSVVTGCCSSQSLSAKSRQT